MKAFSSGFFLAERSLYFNYNGEWAGGHSSWGTRTPSTRWYFAEGSTRENYETWVCLLNPNDEECAVDLTFLCSNGEAIVHSARIPPNERRTVNVNDVVGADRDFFIQVDSDLPVVAERPMYFNYLDAWAGGHDVMGTADLSTDWYFAQGSIGPGNDTWLCFANPGSDDAEVTVELFPGNGSITSSHLTLPGYTRITADLADLAGTPGDYSIHVKSNVPIVAERSMYFCDENGIAGGGCATGSPTPPATATWRKEAPVPDSRPGSIWPTSPANRPRDPRPLRLRRIQPDHRCDHSRGVPHLARPGRAYGQGGRRLLRGSRGPGHPGGVLHLLPLSRSLARRRHAHRLPRPVGDTP